MNTKKIRRWFAGLTIAALLIPVSAAAQGFKPTDLALDVLQATDSAQITVTISHSAPQNWTINFPWELKDGGGLVVLMDTADSEVFSFALPMDSVETAYEVCVAIQRLAPGAVRTGPQLCEPFLIGLPDPPAPDALDIQVVRQWYTTDSDIMLVAYSLPYNHTGKWVDRTIQHDTVVELVHRDRGVIARRADHWDAV